MKKFNILLILGLFILLVGAAQPAQATRMGAYGQQIQPNTGSVDMAQSSNTWEGSRFDERPEILVKGISIVWIQYLAQLNAASSKFEGLLNAYSANKGYDSSRPKGVFDDKSANSAAKADGKATLDHSGLEAQL